MCDCDYFNSVTQTLLMTHLLSMLVPPKKNFSSKNQVGGFAVKHLVHSFDVQAYLNLLRFTLLHHTGIAFFTNGKIPHQQKDYI